MSSSNVSSGSSIPPPPSKLPSPTGNWFVDAYQSVIHVGDIPCARNSLLGGIAGGLGIGIVRAMSASAFVAGNWACATFVLISFGSFQICQNRLANERKSVTRVIESMPRRVVKQADDQDSSTPSGSTASC
ncbi:hypothetical protein E4T56_gene13369 [Termitomyces sp. T112]|nr:hypothetical protein E4T56_gene13369 [Termitomyces sp. T112]KAH0586409.1 hypothetical protein H2248_007645 [Termitomyces sp. 'cryptogamus']